VFPYFSTKCKYSAVSKKLVYTQDGHSPGNVKFPDNSPTVCGTGHDKCNSYHVCTSVVVSGGGRNATVHDPKPK